MGMSLKKYKPRHMGYLVVGTYYIIVEYFVASFKKKLSTLTVYLKIYHISLIYYVQYAKANLTGCVDTETCQIRFCILYVLTCVVNCNLLKFLSNCLLFRLNLTFLKV